MALFRRRPEPPAQPRIDDLPTGSVELDDLTVDLARVRVGARVVQGRLDVSVHHPLVETLSPEDRPRLVALVLGAALGQDVSIVREATASEVTPIDCFDLGALRSFVEAQRR